MTYQQQQTGHGQWNGMPMQMGSTQSQQNDPRSQYFNGVSYLSQIPPTSLQPQCQFPSSTSWGQGQSYCQSFQGPYAASSQSYGNYAPQWYQYPDQNQNLEYCPPNYNIPQVSTEQPDLQVQNSSIPPRSTISPQESKPRRHIRYFNSPGDTVDLQTLLSLRSELASLRAQVDGITAGASKKAKRDGSPDMTSLTNMGELSVECQQRKRQKSDKRTSSMVAKESSASESLTQTLPPTNSDSSITVTKLASLSSEDSYPNSYHVANVKIALVTQSALCKQDEDGKDLVYKIGQRTGAVLSTMRDVSKLPFAVATMAGAEEEVTSGLLWIKRCDLAFPRALTSFETDLGIVSISKLLSTTEVQSTEAKTVMFKIPKVKPAWAKSRKVKSEPLDDE